MMLDAHAATNPDNVSERSGSGLPELRVLMAAPRGFCAGVTRAIDAVSDALARHGAPVYVRRAIVHNLAVVRKLEAEGAIFIQEVDEAPDGAVVILSAHGVAPSVAEQARRRRQRVYDAVCPLVAKVHREVARHHRAGRHVILIGHRDHPEMIGTLGQVPPGATSLVTTLEDIEALDLPASSPLAYAVQTTYSIEEAATLIAALEARFPDLAGPASSDICYATTNRQTAVRAIARDTDAVIVVGEHFSSNACRLAEVARAAGCGAVQLVADAGKIDWKQLPRGGTIGITAAASTPESSVQGVLRALKGRFALQVEEVRLAEESIMFKPLKVA